MNTIKSLLLLFFLLAPQTALAGDHPTLATGIGHTCSLLTDATIHCWGRNLYGQLGDGTMTDQTTPVAVLGLP